MFMIHISIVKSLKGDRERERERERRRGGAKKRVEKKAI